MLLFSAIRGGNTVAADVTAPTLSSAVGTQAGSTTATVGATTDEGNGTLYVVVTTSATQPSVAQIKAGQNDGGTSAAYSSSQSVSSTGAKTFSATGLTASTTYYAHMVHTDAAGNNSGRLSSSSFTTASGGASLFGPDDIKTAYTWGTLPVTNTTTISTQLTGNGWQGIDADGGTLSVRQYPGDASKNCLCLDYVNSGDRGLYRIDMVRQSVYFAWREYRSNLADDAAPDFGPTKDLRFVVYDAGDVFTDIYVSIGTNSTSGTNTCDRFFVGIQGSGVNQTTYGEGDPNQIHSGSYVMPSRTSVWFEVYLKINTPGTNDGECAVYADGTQLWSVTGRQFAPNNGTQANIEQIRVGMDATNGGATFSPSTRRWMTDFEYDSARITA